MGDRNQWIWRDGPKSPGSAVIFDIDGVLANGDARQHYLRSPARDWKGFFEACGQDSVIEETSRLLEVISQDVIVILLTGRPKEVEPQTLAWLEQHSLRWDLLILRNAGDYSGSLHFKRQISRQLRVMGFDLKVAFEDDPRNKEMFESEGIPCVYIHSGYYEDRDAQASRAQ